MPAHRHLARTEANKELVGYGVVAVKRIKYRWLGVERDIAPNSHRKLVRVPNVTRSTECISGDAERRPLHVMAEVETVELFMAQEFILIYQFEPRVHVIVVEEIDG